MRAAEILNRGVQTIENKDESYSYTGLRDFKEPQPEIKTYGPKPLNPRPRSKASQNNSYT